MKKFAIRALIVATAFTLCGGPKYVQAQATQDQQQTQVPASTLPYASQQPQRQVLGPDGQPQQPASQQNRGTTVDPSAGPLAPSPQTIPDAPSAEQQRGTQPSTQMTQRPGTSTQQQPQQPAPEPLGTAAAEGVRTAGSGASRPAGTAIAPAKQSQKRGLLIKLGLLGAAGIAIGTVYGLSRGTSSTPPNTR